MDEPVLLSDTDPALVAVVRERGCREPCEPRVHASRCSLINGNLVSVLELIHAPGCPAIRPWAARTN